MSHRPIDSFSRPFSAQSSSTLRTWGSASSTRDPRLQHSKVHLQMFWREKFSATLTCEKQSNKILPHCLHSFSFKYVWWDWRGVQGAHSGSSRTWNMKLDFSTRFTLQDQVYPPRAIIYWYKYTDAVQLSACLFQVQYFQQCRQWFSAVVNQAHFLVLFFFPLKIV